MVTVPSAALLFKVSITKNSKTRRPSMVYQSRFAQLVPTLDGRDLIRIKYGFDERLYSFMQRLLLLSLCFVLSVLAQIETSDLNCTQKAAAGATNPDVVSFVGSKWNE